MIDENNGGRAVSVARGAYDGRARLIWQYTTYLHDPGQRGRTVAGLAESRPVPRHWYDADRTLDVNRRS